jgi:hypothetical protein
MQICFTIFIIHRSVSANQVSNGEYRYLFCRRLTDAGTHTVLHQSAHLEFHCPFGRHIHSLQRLRVLRDARRPGPRLEYPEVAKLQAVAFHQLSGHCVEKCLNDSLDCYALCLCVFCDTIDKFFFCNRCHNVTSLQRTACGKLNPLSPENHCLTLTRFLTIRVPLFASANPL